jgi:hypothetical protein
MQFLRLVTNSPQHALVHRLGAFMLLRYEPLRESVGRHPPPAQAEGVPHVAPLLWADMRHAIADCTVGEDEASGD